MHAQIIPLELRPKNVNNDKNMMENIKPKGQTRVGVAMRKVLFFFAGFPRRAGGGASAEFLVLEVAGAESLSRSLRGSGRTGRR